MLAEGERDGELELLELDIRAGKMKLSYGGTFMEVCFADQKSPTATPENQIAPAAPAVPANQTSQPLSAEQQAILIEVMREQNKDNSEFPPLPPTIFRSADEP